jgi:hypothetical protein
MLNLVRAHWCWCCAPRRLSSESRASWACQWVSRSCHLLSSGVCSKMNQMHQEKFKKVEHVRQNHLMLGVLGSDRPKRTNLDQSADHKKVWLVEAFELEIVQIWFATLAMVAMPGCLDLTDHLDNTVQKCAKHLMLGHVSFFSILFSNF